jgi:hypothetical protein
VPIGPKKTMTTETLHTLLDDLTDTRELVLARPMGGDPLLAAWRIAADEAQDAYDRWSDRPGALTHAAYVAATEQADAAADALCAAQGGRCHERLLAA